MLYWLWIIATIKIQVLSLTYPTVQFNIFYHAVFGYIKTAQLNRLKLQGWRD